MNKLRKIYCRTFQKAFKFALPFLPYRNPEVVGSVKALPEILLKKNAIMYLSSLIKVSATLVSQNVWKKH